VAYTPLFSYYHLPCYNLSSTACRVRGMSVCVHTLVSPRKEGPTAHPRYAGADAGTGAGTGIGTV